jgi:hypothetical protein
MKSKIIMSTSAWPGDGTRVMYYCPETACKLQKLTENAIQQNPKIKIQFFELILRLCAIEI